MNTRIYEFFFKSTIEHLSKDQDRAFTEVLSAQRDLLSSQLNQIYDKLEQLIYGVSLYKVLGGGVH